MGDRVLITGASGFVGSAVARLALEAGFAVRALVRPHSARTNLEHLDVQLVDGDMRDARAVDRSLEDVRYVFHVAADYRLWAAHPEEIVSNNVEGTRVVMQCVLEREIERVVYTSSVATLHASPRASPEEPIDENQPESATAAIGAYKRSKVLAERLVEKLAREEGLPAVIVNPSTPIGPGDARPTPTGRLILNAALGKVPAYVETGLNLVHVDDVARGHLLALERGRVGQRYILGGDNVSLAQLLGEIAARVGHKAPRLKLPRGPLYPLAALAEVMGLVTGREPFITLDGLRMSRNQMYFSSAKAARDLGYTARPYGSALDDALAWFKAHGLLT